jgi:hypothetical protein
VDTQCKFRFFRTSQGYFFQILSFLKHNLANAFNWRVRNLGLRFLSSRVIVSIRFSTWLSCEKSVGERCVPYWAIAPPRLRASSSSFRKSAFSFGGSERVLYL